MNEITSEWLQHQAGIDYNHKIDLYSTVDKNERFFSGSQWVGVEANGLPTPVFNIFKRVINWFIASILSENLKMQFVPENVGDEPQNEDEEYIKQAAELVSNYSETLWEKKKMKQKIRQWLLDAALSGDACAYVWWNPNIDTGQDMQGDIDIDTVDNVNVFFGNPNDAEVENQPYIIIAFRQLVSKLREEAKANGAKQADLLKIGPDDETQYQSGDRSKIELDNKDDTGKCIALLKLWKEDGRVYAKKITKYTVIRDKWDTRLEKYPVAWMSWDKRKNSYHGQAVGTGLIPNQVFINKMFAMAMMSLMHTAFPKAVYNKSLIGAWNNQIGAAIGVEGANNINDVAKYISPGQMSDQVFKTIDLAIQYTKDMLGASDAALGDVKPENTSAIIAVQQAASVPLESIKQNLYQFVEDIGYIWLDFMANYYGKRSIDVEVFGQRKIEEFDFSRLKDMKFRLKIDVGPSSYWSEITAMQTLDNLLQQEKITFLQYLDRIPNGLIPKRQELIQELEQEDIRQQFIYEQMARFLEQLPPEIQQQIMALPEEEQEQQLMQMMMQPEQTSAPQEGVF